MKKILIPFLILEVFAGACSDDETDVPPSNLILIN